MIYIMLLSNYLFVYLIRLNPANSITDEYFPRIFYSPQFLLTTCNDIEVGSLLN